MAKRKRTRPPIMILWSRAEQRRFIDAVEHLVSEVNELRVLVMQMRADVDRLAAVPTRGRKPVPQEA
jgi:plasmid stabilization system protein ParE